MAKIHGHTSIVLKNVKTGMIDRVESDNVFQSSVMQKFYKGYGCLTADTTTCSGLDSHVSFAENWKAKVGGILLFKNAIQEGSQFMPAGNVMIGNGRCGLTHTGLPTECGSWNDIESSATANAITQVYDFTTDQANGTIGCVCLTSRAGGAIGYGNNNGKLGDYMMNEDQKAKYNGPISTGNPQTRVFEAWSKNIQHDFSMNSDGIFTVTKTKRPITSASIFDGSSVSQTYDLSADVPSGWRSVGIPEVVADGLIRMFLGNGTNVGVGGDMLYIEYDVVNETATVKTLTNSSTATVKIGDNTTSKFVMGDYAIVATASNNYYEIFNVTNGTLIKEIFADNASTNTSNWNNWDSYPDLIAPDLFCIKQNNVPKIYDAVADTVKTINLLSKGGGAGYYSVFTQHGEYDFMRGIFAYNYGFVIHNPLYLATINNLQTAVTKTAAQTMKVTYTLTEEEPE